MFHLALETAVKCDGFNSGVTMSENTAITKHDVLVKTSAVLVKIYKHALQMFMNSMHLKINMCNFASCHSVVCLVWLSCSYTFSFQCK